MSCKVELYRTNAVLMSWLSAPICEGLDGGGGLEFSNP